MIRLTDGQTGRTDGQTDGEMIRLTDGQTDRRMNGWMDRRMDEVTDEQSNGRPHDTQHNDIRHYYTQYDDTQHNDIQHYDIQYNNAQNNNKLNVTLSIKAECS
jgi:hypothetical protein